MEFVPGPDFPTGGVHPRAARASARPTRPAAAACACARRARVEETRRPRDAIVITEIPYQVNKARLIERDRRAGQREEARGHQRHPRRERPPWHAHRRSSSSATRTPRRAQQPLQAHRRCRPRSASYMLAHRRRHRRARSTARRCSSSSSSTGARSSPAARFRLSKAESRAHIVEGLLVALDNIDEVIAMIRASRDAESARAGLVERYSSRRSRPRPSSTCACSASRAWMDEAKTSPSTAS